MEIDMHADMLTIDFCNTILNTTFIGSIVSDGMEVSEYTHHCARMLISGMRMDHGGESLPGIEKVMDDLLGDSVIAGLTVTELLVGSFYLAAGKRTNSKNVRGHLNRFPLRIVNTETGDYVVVSSASTVLSKAGNRFPVSRMDERLVCAPYVLNASDKPV